METFKVANGDIVINENHRVETVNGSDKLNQTIMEMLSIDTMENGFGAGLSVGVETTSVSSLIRAAVKRWKTLQDNSILARDSNEKIGGIKSLKVINRGTDIVFDLVVSDGRGNAINVEVVKQ